MKIIVHNLCCLVCSLVYATVAWPAILRPADDGNFLSYPSLVDMNPSQTCKSRPRAVAVTVRPVFSLSLNAGPAVSSEAVLLNDIWHPYTIGNISQSAKFAAVRFITDNSVYVNFDKQIFDVADLCADTNYKVLASSCTDGTIAGRSCAYSSDYIEGCYEPAEWCLKYGYGKTVSSCGTNEKPTNPCPYNPGFYKSCENAANEICEQQGYFLNCETGKIHNDTAESCPEDGAYKKCVCNPCEGFPYTAEEAGAQGYVPSAEVCNSCGTIKYKRQMADCGTFVECDCGGVGEACWSGSRKMYESCKDCTAPCEDGLVNLNTYFCKRALRCWIKY